MGAGRNRYGYIHHTQHRRLIVHEAVWFLAINNLVFPAGTRKVWLGLAWLGEAPYPQLMMGACAAQLCATGHRHVRQHDDGRT